MDYEKAYKEALSRAKSFRAPDNKDVAAYIFPVLKESEGKSIKKRLIELLKKNDERHFAKEIAWLEKQGEQKPAEWRQDNVEELTEFENAMMHIGVSFFGDNAGLDPNDTNAIKEQANLLLELVPKQGWSEDNLMNKVIGWLPNAEKYVHINVDNNGSVHTVCYTDKMISDFREAMGIKI